MSAGQIIAYAGAYTRWNMEDAQFRAAMGGGEDLVSTRNDLAVLRPYAGGECGLTAFEERAAFGPHG